MTSYNRKDHDDKEFQRVRDELSIVLQGFSRQGAVFKTATSLAKQLEKHVGRHYTNLMKNHHYRRIIEDHLLAQTGNVDSVPDELATAPVLLSKLRTARLEISNIKAHVKTLVAQDALKKQRILPPKDDLTPTKLEVDLSITCDVLHDLIERIGGTDSFEIDPKAGNLLDKYPTGGRDEVVGGRGKARAYIKWIKGRLQGAKMLPGGKS